MKDMHIRDFLRGGYKGITEPTIITKHGRPIAVWSPYGSDWALVGASEYAIIGKPVDLTKTSSR